MKSFYDFFNEEMNKIPKIVCEKYKEYCRQEMEKQCAPFFTAWGLLMPPNSEERFDYFKRAADAGYPPALYELGLFYQGGQNGQGGNGNIDEDKAVECFKKSASKGYLPAQYALCLHEIKALKDKEGSNKEAVDMLVNAMEKVFQYVQMQMALKYPNSSFEQAKNMADVGFEPAIIMLGTTYLNDMMEKETN